MDKERNMVWRRCIVRHGPRFKGIFWTSIKGFPRTETSPQTIVYYNTFNDISFIRCRTGKWGYILIVLLLKHHTTTYLRFVMHPICVSEIAWDNYHFAGASNNLYAALFFRYTSLCGTSSTPLSTDAFYNIMDLVEAAAMGIFCKVCWYRVQINGPEVQGKKGNRRTKGKLAVVKVIDGMWSLLYTHKVRVVEHIYERTWCDVGGRKKKGKIFCMVLFWDTFG